MSYRDSDEPFVLNIGSTKPFLSLDEQIDLLQSRGLIINNREQAKSILKRTNYYRLSAYSLTKRTNDVFDVNVSFDDIYTLYRFDDAFRNIIMKYSQIVEVALRSHIAYEHSRLHGPLGYMDASYFLDPSYHEKFIIKLTEEIDKSDDIFVDHYKENCNSVFPIWSAIECVTFGTLSKLYKNLLTDDKNTISKNYYGVSREYVENWLQATVVARNIAAHGGRFYWRLLNSVRVKLPSALRTKFNNYRAFAYIFAIQHLLPTHSLASSLRYDLMILFSKYPYADIKMLGFPDDWNDILVNNENRKAD